MIDKVVAFGLHLISHVFAFLVRHFASLNNSINLFFDFSIGFFKQVGLCAQHIQEVVQTVVLLLCLDEGGDCLLDRADTSGLFDLVEGILHRTHIPHVLVHQSFLAFVCGYDLGQSESQHIDVVAEVADGLLLILGLLVVGLIVLKGGHVVLLSQLFAHLLDLVLEGFFVFLVFGAKCDTLVGVLFGKLVRNQLEFVLLGGFLLDSFGFRGQLVALVGCGGELFSK